jgi:hypothetical protein
VLVHPAGEEARDPLENWYAYWGLPHRTLEDSVDLAERVQRSSAERAPFRGVDPLPFLRYWSAHPVVNDALEVLRGVGSLWPGFALILCGVLGLNRRTCVFMALVYVLDGVVMALCCPSEIVFERYQSVWLVTDTTLAGAFVAAAVSRAGELRNGR